MSVEFKVVSGSTNVILLINGGNGTPAQVSRKDGNTLYEFIVNENRLAKAVGFDFPKQKTCRNYEDEFCSWFHCSECGFAVDWWAGDTCGDSLNYCPNCGAKVVAG